MDDEVMELLSRPTISIEEAGMKIFRLTKNGSYAAAKRGDFETIKFGKLYRVPTAPLKRKLGIGA
jgi:hypothetical protein